MKSEGALYEEVHHGGSLTRPSAGRISNPSATYRGPACEAGWEEPYHERAAGDSSLPSGRRWGRGVWWSIGGAVLSVVGFVCLALFEQYNSSLSELRADLKHFNEVSAEFVKRESLRKYSDHIKESRQELHESRSSRKELERELAVSKKDREEMLREIQRLRERLAAIEGRQAAAPVVVPLPAPSAEKGNIPERSADPGAAQSGAAQSGETPR